MFMDQSRMTGSFTEVNLEFQRKILERSGLGDSTYLPEVVLNIPPNPSMNEARKEAGTVMFGAIDELFAKTSVKAKDIGILILLSNCLFRMGGAAVLLSNQSSDRRRSKYRLVNTVCTNKGADDKCFGCITQEEDVEGKIGVTLSRDLMTIAEAKGRIKKGDRTWQIAFGSGFKCNSAVWKALKTINPAKERNPWVDEIHQFPVDVPTVSSIK
ncbi:Thiolase-like [Sesbania bispinosa]|nr:Thiolase-like [Sesbania bispinosa]